MKTRIISILALLFISISFYAQDSNNEHVKFHRRSNGIETKTSYQFNDQGKRTTRTLYLRDTKNNWIAAQKHEYRYDNQGRLSEIICTEKDRSRNDWASKSQRMIHHYGENGKLIATKQMEINNERYLLATK